MAGANATVSSTLTETSNLLVTLCGCRNHSCSVSAIPLGQTSLVAGAPSRPLPSSERGFLSVVGSYNGFLPPYRCNSSSDRGATGGTV